MASMPGMENMASTTGAHEMADMESTGSMPRVEMSSMTSAAVGAGSTDGSGSVWRFVIAALAVYFLLSIGASVWARVRGTGARGSRSAYGWGRWLLAMPDTVLVFLASLTISVWDRTKMTQRSGHGRRRKLGAAPDAALAAHIGMGGAMSAMLLMLAA